MTEKAGKTESKQVYASADDIEWEKYVDTTWDLAGRSDEYVFNRLASSNATTAGLAGFIGGFTFVVSSEGIEFSDDNGGNLISPKARREIFGFIVTLAFISAFMASMLSASYLVLVHICGTKKVKYFVKEFYFEKNCLGCGKRYVAWTNVPWYLMNFSVILMIAGIIVTVGGSYTTGVFVTNLLYMLFLVILGGYMFNVMWFRLRAPDFGKLDSKKK